MYLETLKSHLHKSTATSAILEEEGARTLLGSGEHCVCNSRNP